MAWEGLKNFPAGFMDSRGYIRKKVPCKGWKGVIINQTNIRKVSKAMFKKLLRDGLECTLAFLSAETPSWTQLYWSGFMAWKGSGRLLHKVDVKYSLTVLLTLTLFATLETSWLCSWQGVSHLAMGCYMTSCWNSDCSYILVSDQFFK